MVAKVEKKEFVNIKLWNLFSEEKHPEKRIIVGYEGKNKNTEI